jgi:DNA-binding IscR family transcriptional regulator
LARGLSQMQGLTLTWAFQSCGGHCCFLVSDLIKVCHEDDFTRATVGAEAYDAEHVFMSKMLSRLESRGLIEVFKKRNGGGTLVLLTPAGEAAAKELIEQVE